MDIAKQRNSETKQRNETTIRNSETTRFIIFLVKEINYIEVKLEQLKVR